MKSTQANIFAKVGVKQSQSGEVGYAHGTLLAESI
jgi:hypothetical protein